MRTVLFLGRDQLGDGDPELGQKILCTFLRKSVSLSGLEAVLMVNNGVKLVAEGSPVLAELTLLEERGVDLMPCGTCLNHYGIEPRAGQVSDMDAILGELERAEKVVAP